MYPDHKARRSEVVMRRQRGAAMIEFGFVAVFFFMLLLGIVEMARALFMWNSAAEATRIGARVAAVCDKDSPSILKSMKLFIPDLTAAQVQVAYSPAGCNAGSCNSVTVTVSDYSTQLYIPVTDITVSLPPFTTTLTRESMQSTNSAGAANPVCF
jgi:Flp pilus assembly protein TadG